MEMERPLNRRKDDRYLIDEIPVNGIGTVLEISKNGLKIKKTPGFNSEAPSLTFSLSDNEIKAHIRWQDKTFIGLRIDTPINNPALFSPWIKKSKEIIAPAQMKIHLDQALANLKKDEGLIGMINLLMEVDSSNPDIRKIGRYIDEISAFQEEEFQSEAKASEAEGEEKKKKTFKEELIAQAVALQGREETQEMEVDFAITILGLSNVGDIIQEHINKRVFQSESSQSLFKNYETFSVLKSVLFKNLCRFFGLQDIQQEGNTLLSLETTGVDLLIKESSGILDTYYKFPSRIYSEFSRMYERAFFAVDPIQINQHYIEKGFKTLGELFNGYILAHHTLNPHYVSSDELKITLNKNGIIFSYLACLTFLAVQFLMDKDRESGFVLAQKLRGRGMDEPKINHFLDQSVNDTKTILRNLKLSGTLSTPLLPEGLPPIESYLGSDIRFQYLVQSFRDFDRRKIKRMALRYEDPVYAHFILGKLLKSEGLNLSSKTICVVPCRNMSEDQWYIKDFDYLDLIIFKDIQKLSPIHLSAFLKLWNTFEAQIIATFSHLELMDYTNPSLYSEFNKAIVDFPSYFHNDAVYEKMIDHTLQYLQPYLGDQSIDRNRYTPGVFTMNHIKADILLNKEIV